MSSDSATALVICGRVGWFGAINVGRIGVDASDLLVVHVTGARACGRWHSFGIVAGNGRR
jgi:hypothetical protein